ncbi:MAG: hypothetical protein ABJB66_17000, partial [Gemmatimonadaceae bacterium]
RLAYIIKTSNGESVVLDGVVGHAYSAIRQATLSEAGRRSAISFSPDGKRMAYVVRKDDKWLMVVDGVESAAFDDIELGAVSFSDDSRHVAFIGRRGGKSVVVHDGAEGKVYDEINQQRPKFLHASDRVLYTAKAGDKYFVAVDGKEGPAADYVGEPLSNGNGDRLVYTIKQEGAWKVVVDGVQGNSFRSIGNNLVFSADGKRFLYLAGDSLFYVVVDGVKGAGYGDIRENSYAFSTNGAHIAFVTQQSRNQMHWVLDGRPQQNFEWVSNDPAFNGDGTQLTYVAEENRQRFVVIGTREGERFDDITEFPHFTESGRVVYTAKRGNKSFVVFDTSKTSFDAVADVVVTKANRVIVVGRVGTKWTAMVDGVRNNSSEMPIGPISTSSDGKHIAYAMTQGDKRLMVLDGIEARPYDDVQLFAYSADAKHTVYRAQRGKKFLLVVDGQETAEYDDLLSFPSTEQLNAASFTFLATRGNADVRVSVPLKQ